jgi:hypothetical protein
MYLRLVKGSSGVDWSTVTYNTPGFKCFETVGVDEFVITHDNGITEIPMPEKDQNEKILIKLFGLSESFTFAFRLTPSSGVDRYADTLAGFDGSVLEQINFINDNFITAEGSDEFGFYVLDGTTPSTADHPPGASRIKFYRLSGVFNGLTIAYIPGTDSAVVRINYVVGTVES